MNEFSNVREIERHEAIAAYDRFEQSILRRAYGDVYSPDWPDRDSLGRRKETFPEWLAVGLLVLMVCFGISMVVHMAFQTGLYCKWFF